MSEVHVHLVVRSLEDAPTKRWTACVDGLGTRTIVHERRDPGPPSSREEAFRWDFLVLRNALERAVAEAPEARHVLLSYHLAESGYVAQQVADTLGLTHVGCASDDDFERDYRSPLTWSGIVFVLRRATCLVIDDAEQERFLRPLTGGAARLELIGRSLGLEEARRRWRGLFDSVFRRRGPAGQRAQKRVLFFVFDGAGCGHLQRMTRLAAAVQGPCAALVVSGHRDASWLTPDDCEYVYLPGFDSLLADKARFWNRRPFMRIGSDDAVALRQSLLRGVVESFAPDVLVVDHLVFGKRYELAEIVREYDCKKYFVMRGIMGDPVDARIGMLGGEVEDALLRWYDRVLVGADRRICDVASEYDLCDGVADMIRYIGYVSAPVSPQARARVRAERGIPEGEKWVVCSAGGGALGERVVEQCGLLASEMPDVHFDIVCGPRSGRQWGWLSGDVSGDGRVLLSRASRALPLLHGSADVVVCAGGYNSVVESMEGGARIVVMPAQTAPNDEQYIQARRLREYYPIEMVVQPTRLKAAVQGALASPAAPPIRGRLDFDGPTRFRELLLEDLGI